MYWGCIKRAYWGCTERAYWGWCHLRPLARERDTAAGTTLPCEVLWHSRVSGGDSDDDGDDGGDSDDDGNNDNVKTGYTVYQIM